MPSEASELFSLYSGQTRFLSFRCICFEAPQMLNGLRTLALTAYPVENILLLTLPLLRSLPPSSLRASYLSRVSPPPYLILVFLASLLHAPCLYLSRHWSQSAVIFNSPLKLSSVTQENVSPTRWGAVSVWFPTVSPVPCNSVWHIVSAHEIFHEWMKITLCPVTVVKLCSVSPSGSLIAD